MYQNLGPRKPSITDLSLGLPLISCFFQHCSLHFGRPWVPWTWRQPPLSVQFGTWKPTIWWNAFHKWNKAGGSASAKYLAFNAMQQLCQRDAAWASNAYFKNLLWCPNPACKSWCWTVKSAKRHSFVVELFQFCWNYLCHANTPLAWPVRQHERGLSQGRWMLTRAVRWWPLLAKICPTHGNNPSLMIHLRRI